MLKLTPRELEVSKYLVLGFNNVEIGRILCISKHTVKVYVKDITERLQAKNRTEVAYILGKNNII